MRSSTQRSMRSLTNVFISFFLLFLHRLKLISEIEMARLDNDPADKLVASLNMLY